MLLLATGHPAGIAWGLVVLGLALVAFHARTPSVAKNAPSTATSAYELQRAAGALQARALSTLAVDSLPVTVAHVEEALDRLSVSMEQLAHGVAECSGERDNVLVEESLPPEARALRWHLRNTARALRASRDACAASREWSRRLLDERLVAGDLAELRPPGVGVARRAPRPAGATQAPAGAGPR